MRRSGVWLVVLGGLLVGPASAWGFETRDRLLIDLGAIGIGPGIPEVGEGLAVGGDLGVLVQEEEGDYVVLFRPSLWYARSLDGWGEDTRDFDLFGLAAAVGFGISDLDRALPYAMVGLVPTGTYVSSDQAEGWDWGVGMRGAIGVGIALGDGFMLRPEVGFTSFLFTDLDRPLGGLWFSVAFGFDLDPRETDDYYYPPPPGVEDFELRGSAVAPAGSTPGGAAIWVERASGFTDPVMVWAEAPSGIQTVVRPDGSGTDRWTVWVVAPAGSCTDFNLTVHGESGDLRRSTSIWVTPTCGAGGAP